MQPYQNYFPQMNNGYNQQFQNPYQQRMDFLQNYQQNLQQPLPPAQMPVSNQQTQSMQNGLNGKVVQSADMITVNDVPMDCTAAVFPKQDLSEIYVKYWDNNGIIRTIVFKPLLEDNTNNSTQTDRKSEIEPFREFTEVFEKRFDNLENRIDEILSQSMTKSMTKTMASKTKKESEAE